MIPVVAAVAVLVPAAGGGVGQAAALTPLGPPSWPEREVTGLAGPERDVTGLVEPEREVAGLAGPEREVDGLAGPEAVASGPVVGGPVAGGPAWAECGDGLRCATLSVPADWARPREARTVVELAMLPAQDPARRLGALVVNTGSASVVREVRQRPDTVGELARWFDVVLVEARGAGERGSAGACPGLRPDPARLLFAAGRRAWRAFARDNAAYDRGCRAALGPAYAGLTSWQVAHDLDAVRAALGEPRLRYLGNGYGSVYGQAYLELFPGRAGRMYLEGLPDHTGTGLEGRLLAHARAQERQLGYFRDWCRTRPGCPLGHADAIRVFDGLLRRAPLRAGADGRTVSGREIAAAVWAGLAPARWPALAHALSRARTGDAAGLAAMTPADQAASTPAPTPAPAPGTPAAPPQPVPVPVRVFGRGEAASGPGRGAAGGEALPGPVRVLESGEAASGPAGASGRGEAVSGPVRVPGRGEAASGSVRGAAGGEVALGSEWEGLGGEEGTVEGVRWCHDFGLVVPGYRWFLGVEARLRKVAPRVGWLSGRVEAARCLGAARSPGWPPHPVAAGLRTPSALVGMGRLDSRTPSAASAAGQLPGARVLWHGDGQGAYLAQGVSRLRATCLRRKVHDYLVNGVLPKPGTFCQGELTG
ncbi:alpha/beta hydrolase [Nonomuraea spiralis]|uniref:alpha/beta hydrolase n=1 Tax=Nonomuraea spiralis TaxID=46182 RepID=UPI0037B47155